MNTNKKNAIENEKKSIMLLLIFLKTESEISKEKIEETNEFH